jgi:hypothetical protein
MNREQDSKKTPIDPPSPAPPVQLTVVSTDLIESINAQVCDASL